MSDTLGAATTGPYVEVSREVARSGTHRTFDTPFAHDDRWSREAVRPRCGDAPARHRGHLRVEDEPAVRAVAGRILRDLGYAVIEATGPTHALAICSDGADGLDLVITDVVMPEMNGRVLAERTSSQVPALAVLFMSGHPQENVFRRGYLVAGAAYLQKPFTRADLAVAVRSVLDAGKSEDAQGSGSDVRR